MATASPCTSHLGRPTGGNGLEQVGRLVLSRPLDGGRHRAHGGGSPSTGPGPAGTGCTMTASTAEVAALNDPVAQQLLASRQVARLAYTWTDGTPRVVPIWFHWNGEEVVMGTPLRAPKLTALPAHPDVAITIDDEESWPYKALLLRGVARIEMLDDVSGEYAAAARRYFGDEQAEQWVAQLRGQPMANVVVRPTWACVLDFVTRFPSALSG